jgi:hypothetical protein
MKTIRLIAALTLFFAINTITTSCSKDDKTVASGITAAEVNTIIVAGAWSVTLYNEAGSEHTSDFLGYLFAFNSNGVLVATSSSATKTGTWNSGADSGSIKITVAFPTETKGAFESISNDWIVLTATNSKIELKHTSSEDSSVDLLTIEKVQ